jgi:hypothetical protein
MLPASTFGSGRRWIAFRVTARYCVLTVTKTGPVFLGAQFGGSCALTGTQNATGFHIKLW